MTDTQPWRDGIWHAQGKPYLWTINGTKFEMNSFISLDYPEKKGQYGGTLMSGDFGEAPETIKVWKGKITFIAKTNIFS